MSFFPFLTKTKEDNRDIQFILYDGKWYIGYVNEWYNNWLMVKPVQIDFQENGLIAHKLFTRVDEIQFPKTVVKAIPTKNMVKLYEAIINDKENQDTER